MFVMLKVENVNIWNDPTDNGLPNVLDLADKKSPQIVGLRLPVCAGEIF